MDSKQRRLNLIKAVEGDDWSEVIDSQTQQTIEGMGHKLGIVGVLQPLLR